MNYWRFILPISRKFKHLPPSPTKRAKKNGWPFVHFWLKLELTNPKSNTLKVANLGSQIQIEAYRLRMQHTCAAYCYQIQHIAELTWNIKIGRLNEFAQGFSHKPKKIHSLRTGACACGAPKKQFSKRPTKAMSIFRNKFNFRQAISTQTRLQVLSKMKKQTLVLKSTSSK